MALVPKINICISSKCDTVNIYEHTSPYSVTTNDTGWGGVNTTTDLITDSKLEIYNAEGNDLLDVIILKSTTIDLYTGVAGEPAPGTFLIVSDYVWSLPDGAYKLIYTVEEGVSVFTNEVQHVLFTCGLDNCIDKIRSYIVVECNSVKLKKQKELLDQLEIIKYGIQSAFSCADFDTVALLLTKSALICDNLCDCGCGDCD